MTPWAHASAERQAEEAASPNNLESKLGNKSIVRAMSRASSDSSEKYTE